MKLQHSPEQTIIKEDPQSKNTLVHIEQQVILEQLKKPLSGR